MFKNDDSANFIAYQRDKIAGLKKFNVTDIEHISQLPPKARLIREYWETYVPVAS